MRRNIRCQGAIIRNDHILLIKHREKKDGREYWAIPGGGREKDETEEECVIREMKEETNLDVTVKKLLLDLKGNPEDYYQRLKTYLCLPKKGEAHPGCEPEFDIDEGYAIVEVAWFDLRDETTWDKLVIANPFTYPTLQKIQVALGYIGNNI